MRIAAIHWPTSSVGGINTTLEAYRYVADKRRDTFHVFASSNQRTKRPTLFDERRRVRGGDSFITIDGFAPHHSVNYLASVDFLKSYDVVLTSFLCPHPTKAYGPEPVFEPFLKKLSKYVPIVGRVSDAYWDTYSGFGEIALKYCSRVLVAQKAYAEPLLAKGYDVISGYLPFAPLSESDFYKVKRDLKLVSWMPQWKNIKGVSKFFSGVGALSRYGFNVELYNNGIEYYKMRLTTEWKLRVGKDYFDSEYSGRGKATFFGCIPLPEVALALSRSGFAVDFQGHAAKYEAYLNGSYNHTLLEALYYGAVPVVSINALKTGIPKNLLLAVSDLAKYPEIIRGYRAKDYPRKEAREYVLDNFSAEKQYAEIFLRYR